MSLNVLSDASIVKIFGELDHGDCKQLVFCSFRLSNVFKEKITMPRREAYEFRLYINRSKTTKKPEYGIVAVKWMSREIKHRKEHKSRNIHGFLHIIYCLYRLEHDNNIYYVERRRFGPTDTIEDAENELLGIAKDLLLKKVSSFRVLTLNGFDMSNTLVDEIRRCFSCYSPLKELAIFDCEFPHNADYFSMLMDTFMPENLYMDKSANNVNLTDLHIARTTTRLWIQDNSFTIAPFENIGDQSIRNWIYKTPEKINLTNYKTNITLEGVVKFIQAIAKKYSFRKKYVKKREFHFGCVRWNNDMIRSLMLLHRMKGLKISQDEDSNEITYKHLSFTFAFPRPIFRITEQQARNKLLEIGRQAEEKRNEMPNYSVQQDLDLFPQLINCKEQLYCYWDDLIDIFATIYNGEFNVHAAAN